MPLLVNNIVNHLQKISIMQQAYNTETLDMIYKMVHEEGKTIAQIADYLCAYPSRIQDIYNQAVNNKTKKHK